MKTIDITYSQVVHFLYKILNARERADTYQIANEALANDDTKELMSLLRRLQALPEPQSTATPIQIPRKYKIPSDKEASGLFDPKIFDYYTNYNSPLNQQPMRMANAYPLYSNFGAYNKQV